MNNKNKTTKNLERYEETHDKYGNNINFSDDILSDMTIKGLLGKWTHLVASNIKSDLYRYYSKKYFEVSSYDGLVNEIQCFFNATQNEIDKLTPILEDLVNKNIYGMEDIFIAVFGIMSDEVYMIREFNRIMEKQEEYRFDTDYMWNNCRGHSRLAEILGFTKNE